MNTFLENQNWRYATKKFDASKKVSAKDIEILKEAIRLSSSSYGLQPYKVLIIENPELRAKLKLAAWNQSQITDASHLIIFANILNIGDEEINSYIKNIVQTRNIPLEKIEGYGNFMKSKISTLPLQDRDNWTSKQTYLALANLLNAAADLHIDVTPMEGFERDAIDEILNLKAQGLTVSLIATVGYRHEDDATQHLKKVRKSNSELFINL
jgi:nitroreductase